MANKDSINAKSIDIVNIPVLTKSGIQEVMAKNVMYVPGSAANLFSVSEMINKGFSVTFTPTVKCMLILKTKMELDWQ